MAAAVFCSGPVGTQTNPAAYTAAFEGMEVTTSLLEVFGLLPDRCGSHPLCFIGSFFGCFCLVGVDLLQQSRVETKPSGSGSICSLCSLSVVGVMAILLVCRSMCVCVCMCVTLISSQEGVNVLWEHQ